MSQSRILLLTEEEPDPVQNDLLSLLTARLQADFILRYLSGLGCPPDQKEALLQSLRHSLRPS